MALGALLYKKPGMDDCSFPDLLHPSPSPIFSIFQHPLGDPDHSPKQTNWRSSRLEKAGTARPSGEGVAPFESEGPQRVLPCAEVNAFFFPGWVLKGIKFTTGDMSSFLSRGLNQMEGFTIPGDPKNWWLASLGIDPRIHHPLESGSSWVHSLI